MIHGDALVTILMLLLLKRHQQADLRRLATQQLLNCQDWMSLFLKIEDFHSLFPLYWGFLTHLPCQFVLLQALLHIMVTVFLRLSLYQCQPNLLFHGLHSFLMSLNLLSFLGQLKDFNLGDYQSYHLRNPNSLLVTEEYELYLLFQALLSYQLLFY